MTHPYVQQLPRPCLQTKIYSNRKSFSNIIKPIQIETGLIFINQRCRFQMLPPALGHLILTFTWTGTRAAEWRIRDEHRRYPAHGAQISFRLDGKHGVGLRDGADPELSL